MMKVVRQKKEKGSVELIVIGLIAALIIVLAVPLLRDIGTATEASLKAVNTQFQ